LEENVQGLNAPVNAYRPSGLNGTNVIPSSRQTQKCLARPSERQLDSPAHSEPTQNGLP
jgi:hypothetical protein